MLIRQIQIQLIHCCCLHLFRVQPFLMKCRHFPEIQLACLLAVRLRHKLEFRRLLKFHLQLHPEFARQISWFLSAEAIALPLKPFMGSNWMMQEISSFHTSS